MQHIAPLQSSPSTATPVSRLLLNKADVLKIMGVSRNTLLRWIRNAEARGIPSPFSEMIPGGHEVATVASLHEWVARVRAARTERAA
jgi:transposase-like protein